MPNTHSETQRVNLAALFAGQMEIAFGHFSSVRCAVPRKDSLHLTARKTGIHNMAKSGGRNRRPQGCSLRSHRFRRLKPLTPTLSPATHSAMPSMLPCCTSDLKRRDEEPVIDERKEKRVFVELPNKPLRYLVFLHYGWAWNLASMADGTDSEAKAAAMGCIRVPWFSTATDARHFW